MNDSKTGRSPRAYFTKKLKKLLSDLDNCSEREYQFKVVSGVLDFGTYWVRSRVLSVWVYGSYSRGACECGDLDLIVQIEDEKLTDKPSKFPSPRSQVMAFWRGVRSVQFNVGTPEDNTSNVVISDAILIWKRGFDWKTAIESIKPQPSAGRFTRITDDLPIDFHRIGLRVEEAQELCHAHAAGLLRWRFIPLSTESLTQEHLTEDELVVQRTVKCDRGLDANQVLGPTIATLRELGPEYDPKKLGWSEPWLRLRWADFIVDLGNLTGSISSFEDRSIRGLIVVPFLRAKQPRGLLIIERGDSYPQRLAQYLDERRARWAKY